MMYSMHEITEKLGMTVYTVRHYTDSGLVPDVKRDKNGNRIFDDEVLNWLKAAQFLRGCGLTVREVRHYFDLCLEGPATVKERYQILQEAQKHNAQELAALKQRQEIVTDRINHYQKILAGKTADDSNPQDWDPKRFC
jgi:DNA-binding transcriptional MerR regulator